jgi:hypothetical protein
MRNRYALLAVAMSGALALGDSASETWPSWQVSLSRKMKCGMTFHEVEQLSGLRLSGGKSYECRPDEYWISKNGDDFYLYFPSGVLRAVSFARLSGLMNVARAPISDLCTGAVSFLVTIEASSNWQGATITVDGTVVERAAKVSQCFVMGAGEHEISFQKAGRTEMTKHIELSAGGLGRIRIRV